MIKMNALKKIRLNWNLSRFVSNLFYLMKYSMYDKEREIICQAKDEAIDDINYEFEENKLLLKNLVVLDKMETNNRLLSQPKSFARYGDGEISIIQGRDCVFQKYDPRLARKLLEILQHKRDDLYVGLNPAYFHSPYNYSKSNYRFYRDNNTRYRRFFLNVCDLKNVYLDAVFYGGYYSINEDYDFDSLYDLILSLFKNKKIAIVAGGNLLKKLEHDVFKYAEDRITIPVPTTNAFSSYDEIIDTIKEKVPKDYLVCMMIGPTATAMAADLTDLGYMAWDIGHLPKDYDAFVNKPERTKENKLSFFNAD